MTAPVLDEMERVAEAATASLIETSAELDSLIQIDGRATAGKTACLAAIEDRLRQSDRGFIPIVVGPPARHLDTGPLALADIAVALKHAGAVNGEFDEWANGKHTWRSRADLVRRWIRRDSDRVVLLVMNLSNGVHRAPIPTCSLIVQTTLLVWWFSSLRVGAWSLDGCQHRSERMSGIHSPFPRLHSSG